MILRRVTIEDIQEVMQIFFQARRAQRRVGFQQWEDDYPSLEVLKSDIDNSRGYILDDDGHYAGYVAIASYDEEYNKHSELWDVAKSYAAFHRIAISDDYRGKKISSVLFDLAELKAQQASAQFVRIDTGLKNIPMQHILSKRGYSNLGYCNFVWGERLAYEKRLI